MCLKFSKNVLILNQLLKKFGADNYFFKLAVLYGPHNFGWQAAFLSRALICTFSIKKWKTKFYRIIDPTVGVIAPFLISYKLNENHVILV